MLKRKLFEKKWQSFQCRKDFDLFFSPYRVWQTPRDSFWGSTSILTNTVEVTRSFMIHLSCCWKQRSLKKAIFPVEKRFWPIFFRIIECVKPQGTIFEGPKVFSQSLAKLQDHFCNAYEVVENNFFEKNGIFPAAKKLFCRIFSGIIVNEKGQGTT